MHPPPALDADRLFPADPGTWGDRALYAGITDLPIVSPRGHTDPAWFASHVPWENAIGLLLARDHNICRMLYSHRRL